MKTIKLFVSMLVSMTAFTSVAQPESEYKRVGKQILITHYYPNGTIKEQGHYFNGVPNGKWMQFDEEGSILAESYYENGNKEGKWFIWKNDRNYLLEVTYRDNVLSACQKWKKDLLVDR